MGRRYPETPIIGVGGIVIKENCLLLVKRGTPPSKGCWGVPGGCLELGEDVKDGVVREVFEECGIEVRVGELFDFFQTIVYDESGSVEYHYVLMDFFAEHVSGEIAPGGDAADCSFIPLDVIYSYSLTPGVRELLKRLRDRGAAPVPEEK